MKRLMMATTVFAAIGAKVGYADMPRLDSSEFAYRYEMLCNSPSGEDLDGNGYKDFTGGGTWIATNTWGYAEFNCGVGSFIGSTASEGSDGDVWKKYGITSATGFTIETRLMITADTGDSAALGLDVGIDGSPVHSFLQFRANGLKWGDNIITNMDTTAAFHTYRIARSASDDTTTIWVDGNLVAAGLGSGLTVSGATRLLFGSIGTAWKGKAKVAYLRFIKGGYAPLNKKDILRDSEEFEHKYEMDASDGRFSPTATATDWVMFSGESGTAGISDGIFFVNQGQGQMRYYRTVGQMDSSISASSPLTVEIKARINRAWNNVATGLVLNLLWGTPRSSTLFNIGTNSIVNAANTSIHSGDNSDKFHVFRFTYKGEWPNSYTLYRDGELVCEGNPQFQANNQFDYFRFGITSQTSHGGAFDVDYIRWTTKGAFAPPNPKKGLVFTLR